MVGAAGVVVGHRVGAEVEKRLEPAAEDGPGGGVALGVDAADLAAAVVQVEVGREVLVRRLDGDRPLLGPGVGGALLLLGGFGLRPLGVVALDVCE